MGCISGDDEQLDRHGDRIRHRDRGLLRAVVVHNAWYANDDMIKANGKLGRSQGCFAAGENKLGEVFSLLGKGRMIFAARS